MTTSRPEIAVEGSDDGRAWREYTFRYKPSRPEDPGGASEAAPANVLHDVHLVGDSAAAMSRAIQPDGVG